MANSIIKYYTSHNQAIGLFNPTFKDESGNVLTVLHNDYVESEGCCKLTLSGELSRIEGSYLFYINRETVTSVIFPEGLKYIGENLFYDCK